MKRIIVIATMMLTACSMMPRNHDGVMFDQAVGVQIQMDKLNCSNKDWGDLIDRVHHLKVYAELRNDPQAKALEQLEEGILKAYNSKSAVFCDDVIKLNRTRISVVEDAWRGR